jgi:hypothetical protein
LLRQLGYTYLTADECALEWKGKSGRVILENVLAGQLKRLNKLSFKGRELPFTDKNIAKGILFSSFAEGSIPILKPSDKSTQRTPNQGTPIRGRCWQLGGRYFAGAK